MKIYKFAMELTQVNSKGVEIDKTIITLNLPSQTMEMAQAKLEHLFRKVLRKKFTPLNHRDERKVSSSKAKLI